MEDEGGIPVSEMDMDEVRNTRRINLLDQREEINEPPEPFFSVCTKPLSELSRTTLAELPDNRPARGTYLLLRALEPPVPGKMDTVFGRNALVLVEDHKKNRTVCCLQGHVHLKPETEIEDLLPVNTVFVLKEPYLLARADKDTLVVVGSPSDFVIVGRSHALSKVVEVLGWREKPKEEGRQLVLKWKEIGNELFGRGKFEDAADAYLFALNVGGDDATDLLLNLNLAAAFLSLGFYEAAIKHASSVLVVRPLNGKALYRAGRAHYELRQFKEAKRYFKTFTGVFPSYKKGWTELARCKQRLFEAEGNVDIYNLYSSCSTYSPILIDHGSFMRDMECRSFPGKERGVYATQDIEAGTLILVEKPIVGILVSPGLKDQWQSKFVQTALRELLKNPKTVGKKLYSLPFGVIRIDELQKLFCDEANELEPILDVRLLYEILFINIFRAENIKQKDSALTCQVYETASRFQHSCLSNCTYLVYNDIITVRTCSPVQRGKELFLRYYGKYLSFREKLGLFLVKCYSCSCMLCALDKTELVKVHELRDALKNGFYATKGLESNLSDVAEASLLLSVKELELTYNKRVLLRLHLFILYCDLALALDRLSDEWEDKVTLYVDKGLESVGLSTNLLLRCAEQDNPDIPHCSLMPDVLFAYAGLMAEKEFSCGRLDLVDNWVKVLLLLERLFRGGNLHMLQNRFSGSVNVQSILSVFSE